MRKLVLILILMAPALACAQSSQEVEYGVLRAGIDSWTWVQTAGGYHSVSPERIYQGLSGATIGPEYPLPIVWEERIFNQLASLGWRVVAAVPLSEGGVQYLLERACSFEPSGCYSGE